MAGCKFDFDLAFLESPSFSKTGELELLAFQATFAKYDKNGDGGLTEEEWYEVMRDSGSDISR